MAQVKDIQRNQQNGSQLPEFIPGQNDGYDFMKNLVQLEAEALTALGTPALPAEEPKAVVQRPWSYTRLSKFDICPSSYKKVYIQHMKPPQAPAALYGIILHEYAAELLAKKAGIEFTPKSLAQNIFDSSPVDWSQESLEDMLDRIEKIRSSLFSYDFPYMPKVVEHKFNITVEGDDFTGIGDVITDDNRLIDHKFVTKKHSSRSPMQLGLYSMGFPEVTSGVYEEIYLTKGGKFSVNMISVTAAELEEGKAQAFYILSQIKKATVDGVFPHHYGWMCKNCAFKETCATEVGAGEPVVNISH